MFNDKYPYRSSMSKTMIKSFKSLSKYINKNFNPSKILEIGSNDGSFIKNFSKKNKKIENLETIIENQVINNFQSLILQSLDGYLLKRYPIKINEKVLNQIKKNI